MVGAHGFMLFVLDFRTASGGTVTKREDAFVGIDYAHMMAKHALSDLVSGDAAKRFVGLSNLAAWGRAVTSALQRLRNAVPGFDDWYQPKVEEMATDELCSYFYRLRTETLKQAVQPALTTSVRVGYLDGNMMRQLSVKAPEGAIDTFIGDNLGGSGWEVRRSDGATERVYASLPTDWDITVETELANGPTTHHGQILLDNSIENCGTLYLRYLDALVSEAATKWQEPSTT
jgi:hypothetical protein